MANVIDNADRRPLRAPGSRPLRSRFEERYAVERSLGYGQRESARRAGLNDYTGIFHKYERRPRVQRRIAYLRSQDMTAEYIEAKRRALEQRLELSAFGNLLEHCKIGPDGKAKLDWDSLMRSELATTVGDLKLDADGHIVQIGRDNALGAIQQLREMRGFKAGELVKLQFGRVVEQLTDEELIRIAAMAVPALPAPIDAADDESADDED
jgi:hypothetical protein